MAELKALRGFMMSTSKDLGFLDLAWPALWCVLHGAQWRFQRCAEFRFGMQLSGFIVQATTKSRILGIHMDSSKAENQGRSTWYLFPWCYGNWCRSLMQHQQLLTTMQVQKKHLQLWKFWVHYPREVNCSTILEEIEKQLIQMMVKSHKAIGRSW